MADIQLQGNPLERYAAYVVSVKRHNLNDQILMRFPNGYGLSIVAGQFTYGLEAAVIKWEGQKWDFDHKCPVSAENSNDAIFGYLETQEAIELIEKVKDMPAPPV